MQWVKFSDRFPPRPRELFRHGLGDVFDRRQNISEPDPNVVDEFIVRGSAFKGERKVKWTGLSHVPMFSDCTYPEQNCYFEYQGSEWLED